MSLSLPDISGYLIMAGSIIFAIAAFMPVSLVYTKKTAEEKLTVIQANETTWRITQVMFGLGAVIVVFGFGYAAYLFRATRSSLAFWIGVLALSLGALAWLGIVYLRSTQPQGFIEGTMPRWPFQAYSFLTQTGLLLLGVGVLGSYLQPWLGYVLIGGAVLFFGLYVYFKDLPPLAYYILFFLAGFMIVQAG